MVPPESVTALVVRADTPRAPHGVEAVAGQDQPPGEVLETADLRDGIRAAAATGPAWIWLLDAAVVPRPDALGVLLRFAQDPGGLPAPLVLASKVVDAAGALPPGWLPQHEFRRRAIAMDACARRVVAIRAARNGSVLVRADAVARFGLPRRGFEAGWGVFEWTARILREKRDPGYLLPGSVAELAGSSVPPQADRRSRLMMLAGPTWLPAEWRREAYVLAADVMVGRRPGRRA